MSTPLDRSASLEISGQGIRPSVNPLGDGYDGPYSRSLIPAEYAGERKRTLLLIYIHGFMGNDNSFQKFPKHLHSFLTEQLHTTHAVHSKIYPRYKTYKAIEVARDNFSNWLKPHESDTTDVVLLGHSMGGLLSAEVVLKPTCDQNDVRFFQHRILGTVNLDAPLLGLHPGIISSGLASIFRKKPEAPQPSQAPQSFQDEPSERVAGVGASPPHASSASSHPLTSQQTLDPNFDPAFPNDVRMKERKWWKNVVHFVSKHNSEGLMDAATGHIASHMEFGGCLVDPRALQQRYYTLRKLEDIDDIKHHGMPHVPHQVRFVQYYTVCHGYPKKPKTPKVKEDQESKDDTATQEDKLDEAGAVRASIEDRDGNTSRQQTEQPLLIEEEGSGNGHSPGHVVDNNLSVLDMRANSEHANGQETSGPSSLVNDEPAQLEQKDDMAPGSPAKLQESQSSKFQEHLLGTTSFGIEDALRNFEEGLPPLPDEPSKPEEIHNYDASSKEIRKYVEKETKRRNKDYEKAMKSWRAACESRKKSIQKMRVRLEGEQKAMRSKSKALADAAADAANGGEEGKTTQKEKAQDKKKKEKEKGREDTVTGKATQHVAEGTDSRASTAASGELMLVPNPYQTEPTSRAVDDSLEEKGKETIERSSNSSGRRPSADAISQTSHHSDASLPNSSEDESNDQSVAGSEETLTILPAEPMSSPETEVPPSEGLEKWKTSEEPPERPKAARANKADEPARSATSEKSEESGKAEKSETSEKSAKSAKAEKPEKPAKPEKPPKAPKERKFCLRPTKNANGELDSLWVKVFMKDVDEVAAHTGLFFPGPHYEKLVGDVGDMIVQWVQDDATKRLILESS